jgi:hypothetical protein
LCRPSVGRLEANRSRFIAEAVRHELDRRRREELTRSLRKPYGDGVGLAEAGFDGWTAGLPDEEAKDLVDIRGGRPVRWVTGEGWVEASE